MSQAKKFHNKLSQVWAHGFARTFDIVIVVSLFTFFVKLYDQFCWSCSSLLMFLSIVK